MAKRRDGLDEPRLPRRWTSRRIDIRSSPYLAEAVRLCSEARDALREGDPFGYTETTLRYVLLRQHAARHQFSPEQLRRMHRHDLGYLAGVSEPNPFEMARSDPGKELNDLGMTPAQQEVKVVENAERARRELDRRVQFHAALVASGVGAVIGSLIAAVVVAIAG